MPDSIYALLMAGGAGTRFWPLSRRAVPKQLLPFVTPRPMLAETLLRLQPLAAAERTLIVTSAHLVDEVARTAPAIPAANIVGEPVGRNTAPCIGLAAHMIARRDGGDPVVGVFAADHHVADPAAFLAACRAASRAAAEPGVIVTLGITPTRAETGYGYIQVAPGEEAPPRVARFVEKPDAARAQTYLDQNRSAGASVFLWNAGIFFFRTSTLLGELRRQLPVLAEGLDQLAQALDTPAQQDALDRIFPTLPSISIDYGVMEGAADVRVVPTECGWSDLGHWGALRDVLPSDAEGNIVEGDALLVDARDTVVVNRAAGHTVAVLGTEGLVVVATPDATLVLPADRSQDVRLIVDALGAGHAHLLR